MREVINCKCGHRAESHGDSVIPNKRTSYPEDYKGCRQCSCSKYYINVLADGIVQHTSPVTPKKPKSKGPAKRHRLRRRDVETVKINDLKRLL